MYRLLKNSRIARILRAHGWDVKGDKDNGALEPEVQGEREGKNCSCVKADVG